MPNLEQVAISFTYRFGGLQNDDFCIGFDFFEEQEASWPAIHEGERQTAMRRFWADTYQALSSGATPPSLSIKSWPPRGVSTFETEKWREYLQQLEIFEISIIELLDEYRGAGTGMVGFRQGIANMSIYFFNHLTELRTLKVTFDENGPAGLQDPRHPFLVGFPWTTTSMPKLERLELTHVFVCQALIDFMVQHKHLHTVILHNAYAHTVAGLDWVMEGALSWRGFFNRLTSRLEAGDLALRHFSFKSNILPYCFEDYDDDITEELISANEYMSEYERVFAYGDVEVSELETFSELVTLQLNADETVPSFCEGKDQAAYDRFRKQLAAMRKWD